MFKQQNGTVLGCFSPPVMVATFLVEVALALYVVVRYKMDAKSRAILALLLCLAAFQIAEYFVCTDTTIAINASRAGYVAITFLPALGLYLMGLITIPLSKISNVLAFLSSWFVAAYFLLSPNAFTSYVCTGNYVIFQLGQVPSMLYGVFYYALLALAIWRGAFFLKNNPDHKNVNPVHWLLTGYAVFIVPVALLTVLHPDTTRAIPSLLCGFAILLAIILGARIAPLTLEKRDKRS
jgi:hypothetical protein